MKYLLDTCALIWWTLDQKKLSLPILNLLNQNELYLSSISIWEVGIKIKNKKLDIGMDIQTYATKLKEIINLKVLPIDENLWIKNLELAWEHKDPADRTIVATASLHDCQIVTSDNHIIDFYQKIVRCC